MALAAVKFADVWPFFVAAILIAVPALYARQLDGRAKKAIDELFATIAESPSAPPGGQTSEAPASSSIEGNPYARKDDFVSVAAWYGDAAGAFASLSGLWAALILFAKGLDNNKDSLDLVLVLAGILPLGFAIKVLLQDPQKFKHWRLSMFQIVLLLAYVAVGGLALILS